MYTKVPVLIVSLVKPWLSKYAFTMKITSWRKIHLYSPTYLFSSVLTVAIDYFSWAHFKIPIFLEYILVFTPYLCHSVNPGNVHCSARLEDGHGSHHGTQRLHESTGRRSIARGAHRMARPSGQGVSPPVA